MPTNSEEQISVDLGAILEGLVEAGVDFILVGGLAAVVQGAPVTTMDVDIVHNQTPENIARLIDYLESIGAFHRRPDDKVMKPRKGDISGKGHALFTTRLGPIDVLAGIEEGRAYGDLLEHAVDLEFRNQTIQVLGLETLVRIKRNSTNPQDRQRLPVLEETLRQLKKEYDG